MSAGDQVLPTSNVANNYVSPPASPSIGATVDMGPTQGATERQFSLSGGTSADVVDVHSSQDGNSWNHVCRLKGGPGGDGDREVVHGIARYLRTVRQAGTVSVSCQVGDLVTPTAGPFPAVGVFGANLVTAWYVTPATGNDANSGTSPGAPLATTGEVFRRIGAQPLDGNVTPTVTIYITGIDAGTYEFTPTLINFVDLVFQGVRNVVWSGTLETVTPWAGASQVVGHYQIQSGGTNPNLTAEGWPGAAFVQDHVTPTTFSPMGKDLGSGTFQGVWFDAVNYISTEPTNGHAVDVYTLTSGLTGSLGLCNIGGGYITFYDLMVGASLTGATIGGSTQDLSFIGCQLFNSYVTQEMNYANCLGSFLVGFYNYGGTCAFASVIADGSIEAGAQFGVTNVVGNAIFGAGEIFVGNLVWGPGFLCLEAGNCLACVDPSTPAIEVLPGSRALVNGYAWIQQSGAAQSVGIEVWNNASLAYLILPVVGPTLPTLQWIVGGVVKTQAQMSAGFVNPANFAAVVVNQ